MNAAIPVLFDPLDPEDAAPTRMIPNSFRPPRPTLFVEEVRANLMACRPTRAKGSRRWMIDTLMLVVGVLVGVYFGNATVQRFAKSYAMNVAHGNWRAIPTAAPTQQAAATSNEDVIVVKAQRPRMPDLNRTAEPVSSDPAQVKAAVTKLPARMATGARGRGR